MWLAIHWVYCCTLFQFLYWSARWVYWEYLVIPGSVREHQKKTNWVLSHLCMQHLCKLPLAFPIPVLVSRSYPLSCFLISSCPSLAPSPSSFWPMKFCLVTILSYSIVNTSHVMLTWCSSSCVIVIAHAVSAKKKHSRPKVFSVWVCESVSPRVSEECVRQWSKPETKCAFQCSYPHSQGLDMLLRALNKSFIDGSP